MVDKSKGYERLRVIELCVYNLARYVGCIEEAHENDAMNEALVVATVCFNGAETEAQARKMLRNLRSPQAMQYFGEACHAIGWEVEL